MIGDDVSVKHRHEWIVLSAKDYVDWAQVDEGAIPVQNFTGRYDVVLLCPHCERTKTFTTKGLYE